MSVKTALNFIQRVRQDSVVRGRLEALRNVSDLQEVVRIGADAGFEFTAQDLRAAFKHDWGMRWMFYGGGRSEEAAFAASASENDPHSF